MNAKKITALALAAVMAAGTTVTAFAEIDVSNPGKGLDADRPLAFEDENVYVDRDGVLVKNPDEYRPGDTIYIRLTEYWADKSKDEKDSKIEDEKERMNVYADWKVGKDAVEDMDIVYKKGDYYTSDKNTTLTFTVDGVNVVVEGADTITDTGLRLAIKAALLEKMANPNFLKDEREAEFNSYYGDDGWVVDGEYFASSEAEDAAKKANYDAKNGYAIYGDKAYASGDEVEYLTDRGFELVTEAGQIWVDSVWSTTGYGDAATEKTTECTGPVDPTVPTNAKIYVGEVNGELKYINLNVANSFSSIAALFSSEYKKGTAYVNATGDAFATPEAALADAVENGTAVPASKVLFDADGNIIKERVTLVDEVNETVADRVASQIAADPDKYSVDYKDSYTYWVKIDTVEDDTTKVVDLAGILYVGRTRNKAEDADNAFHLDAPLSNRVNDSTDYVTVDDEHTFKPDSRSVVKFDKDADDVVLYFGENEDAWFEVDARGQSALNLEFTFDFNREIADLFPKANIDFLTFTSEPSFNRTGTLYIVADADSFIYEVTENGVKEIANAEYDEDEEAWVIRTRKLAAYAISDRELDTSITLDGEDNTTSVDADGNKQNPDTGR